MLENLQKTSTHHIGLQPNSQVCVTENGIGCTEQNDFILKPQTDGGICNSRKKKYQY